MTLTHYQMVSGIYDIFNHICEQYFSGEDDKKGTFIITGGYKKLDKEEIDPTYPVVIFHPCGDFRGLPASFFRANKYRNVKK